MNVKRLSLASLLLMMVCGFGWANTFVKVTKKSQLVPGNRYLLICEGTSGKYVAFSVRGKHGITCAKESEGHFTVQKSNEGSNTMLLISSDINEENKPVAYTLGTGTNENEYTLYDTHCNKYIGLDGNVTYTDGEKIWKIVETNLTFSDNLNNEGNLFLPSNANGNEYINYRGANNSGTPQFTTSTEKFPVALYVESQGGTDVGETMITFARSTAEGATDKNYYATVYYEKDFKLDAHITAYGIDAFDKPLTGTVEVDLNLVQYPTEIVWAKSPVLLKVNSADVEGNPEFIEYPIYMMETATTDKTFATNLKGSGAEGFTVPEGSYIYKLSMVEGEVGFWRTRTSVLPNKAYMEIPAPEEGEGVKSFTFNFNNETAIKEVTTPQKQDVNNDDTYNLLTGQKVNKNYKGLVVKKGKKFFNK